MAATDEEILAWLKVLNEATEHARMSLPMPPKTKAAIHWMTRRLPS